METGSDQEVDYRQQRRLQMETRRKEVARLHDAGVRPADIARKLKISASVISGDLHSLGRDISREAKREERRAEVQKLWDEGIYSPGEIAKRMRAAKTTVASDLKALGLTMDRRRSAPRSHTNQGTVVEDILSMLRASTVTLEQYDFEVINGDEAWVPDHKTLKRWRRDIVAFNKQIRRVQTMITEIQKESMTR